MRLWMALVMVVLLPGPSRGEGALRLAPAGSVTAEDAPRIEVVSADPSGLTLEFRLPTLAVEDLAVAGELYQSVTIPDGGLRGAAGEPAIPEFTRLLAIPDRGECVVACRVQEQQEIEGIRLIPVQGEDGSAFALNPGAYARDDFGNTLEASPGAPALCRDLRLVPLSFSPVRYNPARGVLRVTSRMQVTVRFTGDDTRNAPRAHRPIPSSFDRLYRSTVVNYQGLPESEQGQAGTWLLICPDDAGVVARLQPLLDWRKRKGLPVRLATTAETGTTKESIRDYIQYAYDNWPIPPEYVALAGDASGSYVIPTWHESLSSYNGEGDHPYSMLSGNDILSDVHIGRLSFSSLTELEVIVAKIVGYESSPYMTDTSWFTRALLVGDINPSGISCVQVQQWIKTRLLQLGYTQIDTIFGDGDFSDAMVTALNRGDTYLCYRGWLGMSGWSNTDTYLLTNGWKMPFAVISTCGTGSFAGTTAFSEAFLRAGSVSLPKGAVGAVGTATTGTHTRYNNCYTLGTFQGLLYEGLYEQGVAHTRGKTELYLEYGNSPQSDWALIGAYWNNLMGDPATECWTGVPQPLLVVHPTTLPVGANTVSVTVTKDGQPSPGARVCLWKGEETYVVGQTGNDGTLELPVSLPTAGNLLLTVTKHDRQPYLTQIPVSPQALFVGYLGSTVDDDESGTSSGNGDGQVNPGETIELPVQLKNFGTQTAPSVTATLSSDDPYVTITDSFESFGDIAAGAAVWSADDFDFEIDGDCPQAHLLRFAVDVRSGTNQWHSLLELRVRAADLVYADSTLYGAGGNDLLDPGETVGLSVTLRNDGDLAAAGVTGTLISLSPWILIADSIGTFGNIPVGGTAENTADTFTLSADPSTYEGHLAVLKLVTASQGVAHDTTYVFLTVGQRSSDDPVGPDHYGYYAFDNTDAAYPEAPVFEWIELDPDLGGTGTEITLGDFGDGQDKSNAVDLPFIFRFYGQPFTRATVCSNGWLAMGDTYLTDYRNWSIPGAGAPNNLLAVFWDELYQASESGAFQYYDADNHRWIVEWSRFRNMVGGSTETFEAILYDPAFHPTTSGDGWIVFQYQTVANVDGTDGYATTGIQNFDHTDGVLYTYFNQYPPGAATLASGRAIRFVPVVPQAMGVIQGTVRNASYGDAPIGGARVSVLPLGSSFFTGPDGQYGGNLGAGTYTLVATHEGFAPDTARNVVVAESQTTVQDFSLTDIAGPEILGVTQPLHTPDVVGPYPIQATVIDYSSVGEVSLHYRVNLGAWTELSMTLVSTDEYEAQIPGEPQGRIIDYYIRAGDGIGRQSAAPPGAPDSSFSFCVTDLSYDYTAEDPGDPDWQLGVPGDDATTGIWIRDDPVGTVYNGEQIQPEDDHTPDPGVKCFVTGNGAVGGAAGENDVDGGCTTLMSPVFDLSAAQRAFVTYWRWYAIGGNSMDDQFAVDASSDGGLSWAPLERVAQNRNFWEQAGAELGSIIDLTDQVVFRFVACDLNAAGLVEAAIDDFSLEVFVPDVSGLDERGTDRAVFRLGPARPNPSSRGATVEFSLEKAGRATLAVYDVQGRVVRVLRDGLQPAGRQVVRWDGTDPLGNRLPSGVYFYRLESGGRRAVHKMMRLE